MCRTAYLQSLLSASNIADAIVPRVEKSSAAQRQGKARRGCRGGVGLVAWQKVVEGGMGVGGEHKDSWRKCETEHEMVE